MSVIAIKKIPIRWSMVKVIRLYGKVINGDFEPLNFVTKAHSKTCYIRLSAKLDPIRVVEKINAYPLEGVHAFAFVPQTVPDIPLAKKQLKKLNKRFKTFKSMQPHEVIVIAHHEILIELQTRYPGLYALSQKTKHALLDELSKLIYDRLRTIMQAQDGCQDSCFQLTQGYRRAHPHFGDFQLILSTLHGLQDANGAPRSQIVEKELAHYTAQNYGLIQNVPTNKVDAYCNKYTSNLTKIISEHVTGLQTEPNSTDTEEDMAAKRVREEMKKLLPYIPMMLNQVVKKHFIPKESPYHSVRIYGEPFLPGKNAMHPFVVRYNTVQSRVMRSGRMYNLLRFKVPSNKFSELIAMDGTVISGAKLIIRGDLPLYKAKLDLKREMASKFGGKLNFTVEEEEEEEEDVEMQE